MSAALSIVPRPAKVRRRRRSETRQHWYAPVAVREAVSAAFERRAEVDAIDVAGRVAVLVWAPTVATVLALVGVLGPIALVRVLAAALGVGSAVRLVSVAERRTRRHALDVSRTREQAPVIVYAGASAEPVIVRVGRHV